MSYNKLQRKNKPRQILTNKQQQPKQNTKTFKNNLTI